MTTTTMAEQFFIDAMSPAFRDDPYPHYASYRSDAPLLEMGDGLWFSFTHTDVATLLRHPRMSSDERRSKGFARAVAADPTQGGPDRTAEPAVHGSARPHPPARRSSPALSPRRWSNACEPTPPPWWPS